MQVSSGLLVTLQLGLLLVKLVAVEKIEEYIVLQEKIASNICSK